MCLWAKFCCSVPDRVGGVCGQTNVKTARELVNVYIVKTVFVFITYSSHGGDDRSIILQNIEVMLPVLEHTQVDPSVILRHPVLMTKIKNLQHFKCFLFFRNTAFWGYMAILNLEYPASTSYL